jgi:hypothetical protein
MYVVVESQDHLVLWDASDDGHSLINHKQTSCTQICTHHLRHIASSRQVQTPKLFEPDN